MRNTLTKQSCLHIFGCSISNVNTQATANDSSPLTSRSHPGQEQLDVCLGCPWVILFMGRPPQFLLIWPLVCHLSNKIHAPSEKGKLSLTVPQIRGLWCRCRITPPPSAAARSYANELPARLVATLWPDADALFYECGCSAKLQSRIKANPLQWWRLVASATVVRTFMCHKNAREQWAVCRDF